MAPPRESVGDDVDVSVFAPPQVFRGEAFLVQALVHLPEQASDAAALATEIDPETSRRGVRSLAVPVPDGSVMSIELLLPGLQVLEGVQTLRWSRRAEGVQFEVVVPEDFERRSVIGTLVVSVNGVSIGHIKWKVVISPIDGDDPAPVAAQGEDAVRYRRAFISYATRDRREVLKRVQLLKSLGISYFQDVLDLDPGQRWERELFRQIEDCDVFLLFWSDWAKRSDFVRREVDAALRLAEERHPPDRPVLRPILLGPNIPAPWPELSHLHFNDKLLYFMGD